VTETHRTQELFDSAYAALWAMQARGEEPDWEVDCPAHCEPEELSIGTTVAITWDGREEECSVWLDNEDEITIGTCGLEVTVQASDIDPVIKSAPIWFEEVQKEIQERHVADIEASERFCKYYDARRY